jgi:hypothetical protein
MSVRPLPHFAHSPIGKTTHKRGHSYHHLNYITRDDACTKTMAENMPDDRGSARAFFEHEANKDGVAANARIADTFIIALPIELTREQRHEAIQRFMEKIGHGRIAWLAAFHDKGEDAHNPHCHLILRDADIETGRKVLGTTTSAKDVREAEAHGWKVPPRMTTKDLRVAWCEHLNSEMERHGYEARFDQRTLKQQGIDREAQIHVGPQASAMDAKGKAFDSQDRRHGNHANVYTLLDAGSRAEHNRRIIEANKSQQPKKQPSGREGVEKQQLRARQQAERKAHHAVQAADRAALRAAHQQEKLYHQKWARKLYADARQKAFDAVKEQHASKWQAVWRQADKQQKALAKAELQAEQKRGYALQSTKEVAAVRPQKDEAWEQLKAAQEKERKDLQQRHLEETAALARQHIAERNALNEHWQQQHRQREAARLSARLQDGQSMPAVQATAQAMIKHHKPQQTLHRDTSATTHTGASRQFLERARAASDSRSAIRYELDALRRVNVARAGPRAQSRMARAQAISQSWRMRREAEEQSAKRQAVASGRELSSEERANAPSDVRGAVAARDKERRAQQRDDMVRRLQDENRTSDRGRDRGGGREGR